MYVHVSGTSGKTWKMNTNSCIIAWVTTYYKHSGDTWVAQSVEHPTLGFDSGHYLAVVGSNPVSGFALSAESASDSFSLFLCLYFFLFFSLSQVDKIFKKKKNTLYFMESSPQKLAF